MAKVTYAISNLTGGEVTPRLNGRPDVAKQRNGLRVCENFQIVVHGGARKRSGTQFVVGLKSGSDPVILQPFQYSTTQAYMLVFGPSYIWILKDRGILTNTARTITGITKANPGVVTYTGADPSNGDRVIISSVAGMTEVNNRQFVVANVNAGANTFELSGVNTSTYTTYSSSGTWAPIIEVATTYAAGELQELRFAQYNDILYITHGSHPLKKLVRNSETSWTLSEVDITTGPFRTINGDDTLRITPSAFSGSATAYGTHIVGETCTLTASSAYFTSDMVGALFRLNEDGSGSGLQGPPFGDSARSITNADVYTYDGKVYGVSDRNSAGGSWANYNRVPNHEKGYVTVISNFSAADNFRANFLHPTYCIVQITGYTSTTVVAAEIVRYQMPASIVSSGTAFWEEGAWSAERGYPKACAFFEQRLFLGGADGEPTVLWSSKSGAFEDFSDGPDDDDALVYRASSGNADVIRWLSSGRLLTAGSSAGEFAVAASNQNEALTPTNVKMLLQTTYGTSDCPPVRVNDAVLYPQRDGEPANAARKIREFTYDFASDRFNAVDLTIFAEHITGAGITRMAYQMQPDPMVWAVRTDGELAVCTYERLQEVVAWQRHVLGGTGLAKSVGVCAGASGDDVYVVVERTIASATERYIEVFMPPFDPHIDDKEDAFIVDCGLTYSGSSTSTITGLWHLRGEAVKVLNNGNVESQTVSSTGTLTLDVATTKAHIGYGITASLVTEDLDAGAQAGAAQSRMKRVSRVFPRVYGSLGGTVGRYGGTMDDILYRTTDDVMGSTPALYSGLVNQNEGVDVDVGWDREAILEIEHTDPLPFFVTAIVAELNTTG